MEVWCEIKQDVDRGARRLVAEYGNRLLAAASCLCPNDQDAEELVFRTFDQAVKKIRQYRPTGDFFCWLYTIMLNYRRMDLRRRGPSVVAVGSSLDLPEVPTAALPDLDGAIGSERILAALRALPEAIRAVVVLRYLDDCPVETIARQLAVPVGTVKSRLHAARWMLGEALKKEGVGK